MILKFRYLLLVAVIFLAFGFYIRPAFGFSFGQIFGDSTVNTLDPWKVVTGYITPRNAVNGLKVPALVSCNTIDTDVNGVFSCGTDEGGAGGGWATSSADYWATTDLKLQELSDVQDPNAYGLLLMWTGSLWATTSTSSLGIAGTADGSFSTTSADYWDTTKTARTADDLSNNSIEDLNDVTAITENFGDLLYWNGTTWADIATTSLAYAWSSLVGTPAGFADGTDDTGTDTLDDLSNNTTSDLAEGTNLYWTSARGTTSFNSLVGASSTIPHVGGTAWGDVLYWTGSAWDAFSTSSLGITGGGGVTGSGVENRVAVWDAGGASLTSRTSFEYYATNSPDRKILYIADGESGDIGVISMDDRNLSENTTSGALIIKGGDSVQSGSSAAGGNVYINRGKGFNSNNGMLYLGSYTGNPGAPYLTIADDSISFEQPSSAYNFIESGGGNYGQLFFTALTADRTFTFPNKDGTVAMLDDIWATTSADYWETTQTARTADDFTNNTTSDLSEGTNLYYTSARATSAINTIILASSSVPHVSGTAFGQLLQWTGSAWGASATSTLGIAWANLAGIPAGFADGTDDTGTDTLDDLTNNSIEDLNDVTAMTENFGDLLYWTGTTWADTATSSLGILWSDLRSVPAGFSDGVDDTGSSVVYLASTTPWTAGQIASVVNNGTLTSVATGTLTENITGLEFSATGNLVGSASVLNITSGYSMFLTASGTNWNTFYDTPSNRITAGTGIDWTANTLNGVYTAGDALTLTGEDFDFDGGATPQGELGGTWASPTLDAEALTLSELSDVGAFTPLFGSLLMYNGSTWSTTSTSSLGLAGSIANDSVTPNMLKTTGQTDEYCLTYETTGTTWEWQTCGAGGGNISGWATTTSQVSGELNLYTTNTSDILNIGGSATTSSKFWMDPNTTTFQINGSTGSSTSLLGSVGNEWLLGTSDANKNFRIASSTGLLDGVSEFFTITKTGNIGFGSSTPFAKVSIVHTETTSPAFAVATSTTAAPTMSLWNTLTTLGGSLDSARMILGYPSNGLWLWGQSGQLRDPLNVSRINTGDWFDLGCKAEFAKKTAANTGDITGSVISTTLGGLCGDFSIIEDAAGQVDYVVAAGSGYSRLRPGATGTTNAAGDGIGYALTTAFMRTATNTPIMETSALIQTNGNATSTLVIIGITSATGVSADYAAVPTAGCYFTASTTQANIKAVCKDGATISIADTGTASNTANFIRYRVEMEPGFGRFFMSTSTGKWTNVATLTSGVALTTSLNPQASIAGVSAGTIGGELWVRFIRAWYKDPEWQ